MLPAVVSSKITIVISPVVSLVDDLFDRASTLGIKSYMFRSRISEVK